MSAPIRADQRRAILCAARKWLGAPFDCAAFVCRVALDAGMVGDDLLVPDAAWLIDHLAKVDAPQIGDVIGYVRPGAGSERLCHLMLYAGNGMVIGACDTKRRVVTRPIDYRPAQREHRWRYAGDPPAQFRALRPAAGGSVVNATYGDSHRDR